MESRHVEESIQTQKEYFFRVVYILLCCSDNPADCKRNPVFLSNETDGGAGPASQQKKTGSSYAEDRRVGQFLLYAIL